MDWKYSWHVGVAPSLPYAGLVALRKALAEDDPSLIQNKVAASRYAWNTDAACAIGYCGWKAGLARTRCEVESFFRDVIGKDGVDANPFLTFFDGQPREQMRMTFLPEVEKTIAFRDLDGPQD